MSIVNYITNLIRKSSTKPIPKFKVLIIDDSYGARYVAEDVVKKTLEELHVDMELFIYSNIVEFELSKHRKFDLALVDWNLDDKKINHGDEVIKQIDCPVISIMTGQSGIWADINDFANKYNVGIIKKGKPMQHRKKPGEVECTYFEDTNVEKEITSFVVIGVNYFYTKTCPTF